MTGWIRRRLRSRPQERLAESKPAFRRELEKRVGSLEAQKEGWAGTAGALLDLADDAEKHGEFNQAWALFLAATRMEIFGLDESEVGQRRVVVLAEASEKLSSWRKNAIENLLNPTDKPRQTDLDAEKNALHLATFIRDEALANRWRDIRSLGRRLAVLGTVLAFTVAGILVLAWLRPLGLDGEHADAGVRMWVYVALFGSLGGSLSALRSVTTAGQERRRTRNPEQVQAWYVTVVRPLVGAAAALGVFVVLAPDVTSTAAMLGIAFAAGFSEALIVRAVESAGGRAGATP